VVIPLHNEIDLMRSPGRLHVSHCSLGRLGIHADGECHEGFKKVSKRRSVPRYGIPGAAARNQGIRTDTQQTGREGGIGQMMFGRSDEPGNRIPRWCPCRDRVYNPQSFQGIPIRSRG